MSENKKIKTYLTEIYRRREITVSFESTEDSCYGICFC